MSTPGYYDGTTPNKTRQQQALNSALVDDQNTVDPHVVNPGDKPYAEVFGTATGEPYGWPDDSDPSSPGYENPGYWDLANASPGYQPHRNAVTPTGEVAPPPPTEGPPPPGPGPSPSGLPNQIPQTPAEWMAWINQYKSLYNPSQLPNEQLQTYDPMQLMGPDAQNAQKLQFGLLERVLQNPDAYSEQNVRQMQEAQKEQALASQQSEMQKLTDRYAARGRFGSGQLDAAQRRMGDNTTGQILQSGRDIALQAANANWNSRLGALNSANDVIGASVGNQQAQAGEELKGVNSQNNRVQYSLQRALAQEGLNKDQSTLALQAALSTSGLSLDQYKAILAAMTQLGTFNAGQANLNSFNL